MEFLYWLFGFRKTGAHDSIDRRDFVLDILPNIRDDKSPEHIDNRSWRQIFQGATTRCVLFSVCKVFSGVINLYFGERLDFKPNELKKLMGDKYKEGFGCWIRDAVAIIVKIGLHDQFGRLWRAKKYIKIPPEQFSEALIKGFSFITGSYTKSPMCNKWWYWIPASMRDGGGHSTVCYGQLIIDITKIFTGDNHWKGWGKRLFGKATSSFFWHEKDVHKLFTSFTFIDPYIVEE